MSSRSNRFRSAMCCALLYFGTLATSGVAIVGCRPWHTSKVIRLAVLLKARDNSFYDSILSGIQEGTEKNKFAITVFYGTHEDDWESQSSLLGMAAARFDGVILVPIRSDAFEKVLRDVNERGIPVVIVDTPLSTGARYVLKTITSNNRLGGQLAGQYLVSRLRREGVEKGCVVVLSGNPKSQTHKDRNEGFTTTLQAQLPHITLSTYVAFSSREQAAQIVRTNKGEIRHCAAIYAGSDTMVLGAMDALGPPPDRPAILIGYDAIFEAQRSILEGTLTASVQQYPRDMGFEAIKVISEYFAGHQTNQDKNTTHSRTTLINPQLVVRSSRLDTLSLAELGKL